MTTEEKARAYDEALEDMRIIYPNLKGDIKLAVEHAFPQLRESEDERVIRTLYYLVRDHDWLNGATKGEALTWLEKQKEQKPAEWSEDDKKMLNDIIGISAYKWGKTSNRVSWLKSLRPSWKPSEEQMEAVKCAALDVKRYSSKSVQLELENEPYYGALISLYNDLIKL